MSAITLEYNDPTTGGDFSGYLSESKADEFRKAHTANKSSTVMAVKLEGLTASVAEEGLESALAFLAEHQWTA